MIVELEKYKETHSNEEIEKIKKNSKNFLNNSYELPKYRFSSFVNFKIPDFNLDLDKQSNIEIIANEEIINQYQNDYSSTEEIDIFHDSLCNNVKTINIKKDSEITIKANDNTMLTLFLIIENNSNVTLKQNINSKFYSSRINLILKNNVKATYNQIDIFNEDTITLQRTKSYIKNNNDIKISSFLFGGKYTKSDFISNLNGNESNSEISYFYIGKNNEEQNLHVESRHNNKNNISNIFTIGAIANNSRSLCTGNIFIGKEAFLSKGYETQKALLLSENAQANAIPNLEIHNHDVTCSHGSTIGQIDEEQIFYLMSRGLTKDKAKKEIVKGFFKKALEQIQNENLENEVTQIIDKSL